MPAPKVGHRRPKGTATLSTLGLNCGSTFLIYRCHFTFNENRGKFCSVACKAEWQRENMRGENHPGWRGGKIERQCIICGETFGVKPKDLKQKGGGSYCSRKCLGIARQLKMLWNNPTLRTDVRKKLKANWQDPEYREKVIKNTLKGLLKRPTSLEQRLIKFFTEHRLPFAYVGDGSFLIGYKNPDFININGHKICIEVSNSFFHRDKPDWVTKRKAHFKKYGWDCIILETDRPYLSEDFILETLGPALEVRGFKA